MQIRVNQTVREIVDENDRVLLWVLRDELGLTGRSSFKPQKEVDMPFPVVNGANLSGKRYRLPHDFEGDYNAVVIPYLIEQQRSVDTWTPTLQHLADQYPTFRFYEVPVLRNYNVFQQHYINMGMRSGISDKAVRDRTITLYLDVTQFNQSLGLPGIDTIYTLLVNRRGDVIWQAAGACTSAKSDLLRRTLAELATA